MPNEIEKRKLSHLELALRKNVQSKRSAGFENIYLIHRALPEIDRDKIDPSIEIFNHKLNAPLILESMTGGTNASMSINSALAEAAEELGVGMGVGSQRAAIEDPKLAATYRVAREKAPNAFLVANIGCPQLRGGNEVEIARAAIEMIDADALYIHLNPLQESVQLEGETEFSGVLRRIRRVVKAVNVPVVVKETGAGISAEVAIALQRAGVAGIDVAGAGGTSWAAVEHYRAKEKRNLFRKELGETFWDWGIPTAASIVEVTRSTHLKVIASGGIRNGIDVAKSITLGADAAGFARPLLKLAVEGRRTVEAKLLLTIEELKTAMFLTGCRTVNDLARAPVVIVGETREWLEQRGFSIAEYAMRKKPLR